MESFFNLIVYIIMIIFKIIDCGIQNYLYPTIIRAVRWQTINYKIFISELSVEVRMSHLQPASPGSGRRQVRREHPLHTPPPPKQRPICAIVTTMDG